MGTQSLSPAAGDLAIDVVTPGGVGIVTALAAEARALTRYALRLRTAMPLEHGGALWLSCMGQDAARQGALALVEAGVSALVSFGVAGGLAPELRSGTLFCPSHVRDEHGRDYLLDPAWRAALMQRLGPTTLACMEQGSLLSLPAPLLNAADKALMHDRHHALAVDMESAAIAAVASEYHLPFLVLRAVVDERDDAVPGELHGSVDAWGRPRTAQLLRALLRHPGLLAQLPVLARRMNQATRALRAAASAAGTELGRATRQPC